MLHLRGRSGWSSPKQDIGNIPREWVDGRRGFSPPLSPNSGKIDSLRQDGRRDCDGDTLAEGRRL